jgi:hypothetical protein
MINWGDKRGLKGLKGKKRDDTMINWGDKRGLKGLKGEKRDINL